ncbi:nucleotidyl transferase AbiEii/AbiGii toxin family protein [bacterium]|nr:nucleotidyl transferase AbiEii/AbiGii toxin family protein [bacterium]MBU4561990.1 nucleotidyl transferase AbiEii/AbiGii toxin family protein [bacterium]
MLNLKQIESFYPENLRIYKKNLLREYLQYVILDIIYSSEYGSRLVFMGGTAIHIIHGNRRFSEDLDFDNRGLSKEDFEGLSQNVLRKLELYGYSVEIQNRYGGAFHCFVKFPGILHQYGISGHPRENLIIQIDCEPQNVVYKAERVILNKFDIFLKINTVPPDILLAQKIFAILNRPRSMGRDFYDAIFLFSKTNPDFNFLKEKMKLKEKDDTKEIKKKLLLKCEKINFKKLAEDVKPFLFYPHDAEKIMLFPDFILTKMKK